ncbi:MAG TPA: ATP-binding protein, partial [Candidatus Solibacter sp.]|nr:ATP-binding protein [Candidatus Solibacter sp.]
ALQTDSDLSNQLLAAMTSSKSLLEIAVCDPQGTILVDIPGRAGTKFPPYPDFHELVKASLIQKMHVLLRDSQAKYQLSQGLAALNQPPAIYVRVVVYPQLIRQEIIRTIESHAQVSILLLAGAIVVAFLFSAVAFRPIDKLGHMLDLLTSGEFESQDTLPVSKSPADEFGVVASKVNLLGQQLRGAQYDFSDLRGNFEKLLDDLEDAVLVFGRDRRLVVSAGSVEKFLGHDRSQLIGQAMIDIFPASTSLGLLLQQAAQTGRSIRNRRVPIGATGNGSSGVVVALVSVDVLEALQTGIGTGPSAGLMVRLRDPEATRQIGRQLQTADRLAAISRITGGVAHEVKNPLNAILMHVELARMKLAKGDSDLKPQMDIITGEIVRLDRVVKTFLDFTRPVELHPAEVPLERFVDEIAALARPLAEQARIELMVSQEADGVSIGADLDLLKQAMLNVVMNAIEAMPHGGQLRFESAVRGDDAEIRISDTGCGIRPELREKVFGLYFTTKQTGSGIGLAMTFRIVQLHDGTIDFTSEPEKGTTFVIRIPTAVSAN